MADDDKKIQQAADSAKDSAADAQKAEEKARAESDSAETASGVAGEAAKQPEAAAKEAEKVEEKAEKVAEEVKETAKEKNEESKTQVKVSKKLEDIIGQIEKLSVLELSELVRALETKFGVTAAPQAAVAPSGQAASATGDEAASEQTTFNVILADGGANKISVIKAVREIVPTLGLKEAKDLVDAAPKPVVEGVNKETATEAKTKLEAAGAKVELK